MGLYGERVLPHLVDRMCGVGEIHKRRARALDGLEGRVVEIGFGSGHNMSHYGAGVIEVLAVEPADTAWGLAADRVGASPVAVTRVGLDGQSLPIDDGSCDGAVCTFTLCTVPDAALALAELRRVLRPGGTLRFVEHGTSPDPDVARWQRRLDPVQQRVAGGCHLTRDPVAMIGASGFDLDWHDAAYGKGPRPLTYMTVGVATRT